MNIKTLLTLHLLLQSEELFHEIYFIDWTSLSLQSQKNLIILMSELQHPMTIKINFLFELTMESFLRVSDYNFES